MLIIASKPGALGNRLVVFGRFIACAIEYDVRLMNPAFGEYAEFFRGTARDLMCCYPARRRLLRPSKARANILFRLFYVVGRLLVRTGIDCRLMRSLSIDWDQQVCLEDPQLVK